MISYRQITENVIDNSLLCVWKDTGKQRIIWGGERANKPFTRKQKVLSYLHRNFLYVDSSKKVTAVPVGLLYLSVLQSPAGATLSSSLVRPPIKGGLVKTSLT